MHKLNEIKDTLVCTVEEQLTHLDNVDTKELGEVIDMIKDLEAAKYYCAAAKSMVEDAPIAKKKPHIKDLDAIIKDMTEYAVAMAKDATPEQRSMMSAKIIGMANKIV